MLIGILVLVALVYALAADRGSRRGDWAKYDSDVTQAEAEVAAAKTKLRNVKNQTPGLPGFMYGIIIVALVLAFALLSDGRRPRRSYFRDR